MVQLVSDYPISAYEDYARAIKNREDFFRTYHVPITGTGVIAEQVIAPGLIPQPSHVALLTGENSKKNFANFAFPSDYFLQHTFSPYILPSQSPEQLEADAAKLNRVISDLKDPNMSEEGKKVIALVNGAADYNREVREIVGKMLSLLSG